MKTLTIRKPKVAKIETTYTTVAVIDGTEYQFVTPHERRLIPPRRWRLLETRLRYGNRETWFTKLLGIKRLSQADYTKACEEVEKEVAKML